MEIIGKIDLFPVGYGPGYYARTELTNEFGHVVWMLDAYGETEDAAKTNLLQYILSGQCARDRNR